MISIIRYDNTQGRFSGWAPDVQAFGGLPASRATAGAGLDLHGDAETDRPAVPRGDDEHGHADPDTTPRDADDDAVSSGNCHPACPTGCIPQPPPDLDCGDVPFRRSTVLAPDLHRFDSDGDGIGCECPYGDGAAPRAQTTGNA